MPCQKIKEKRKFYEHLELDFFWFENKLREILINVLDNHLRAKEVFSVALQNKI